MKEVSFLTELRVSGTTKASKAIHLLADAEIVVYAVNRETYTNDGYLGIPTDVLAMEYFVVSWSPITKNYDRSQIFIIGVNDSTTVNVHLTVVTGSESITYEGSSYYNGDVLTVTLDRFETIQLQCRGDLSGTHLVSDKIIGIISGNVRTNIGPGTSTDHLTEMIPPVRNWGKNFVTIPTPLRTVGDYFRFVSSESNTLISISGGHVENITLVNVGSFGETLIPSNAYCFVKSTKPILVIQFVQSQQDSSEPSDPLMMVIPPVEQYGSEYTFSTPQYSSQSYDTYFLFAITKDDKDGIKMDGNTINTTFNDVEGTDYVGGYFYVPQGTHVVKHDSAIKIFGAFLYGITSYETYGFPVGMRLAPINEVGWQSYMLVCCMHICATIYKYRPVFNKCIWVYSLQYI